VAENPLFCELIRYYFNHFREEAIVLVAPDSEDEDEFYYSVISQMLLYTNQWNASLLLSLLLTQIILMVPTELVYCFIAVFTVFAAALTVYIYTERDPEDQILASSFYSGYVSEVTGVPIVFTNDLGACGITN
jgi:hypothetical protein